MPQIRKWQGGWWKPELESRLSGAGYDVTNTKEDYMLKSKNDKACPQAMFSEAKVSPRSVNVFAVSFHQTRKDAVLVAAKTLTWHLILLVHITVQCPFSSYQDQRSEVSPWSWYKPQNQHH